jgi:very-short-patch-repair endonuclease
MNETQNKKLTPFAQQLRKRMTPEERHLWYDFLRKLPCTVNRQKVFGGYIADFYIASESLVIELDGGQHYEEAVRQHDRERDEWFNSHGITVLRYTNQDIKHNFNGVCLDIHQHLSKSLPL